MPRPARLEYPGVPLHVRHRGNNRGKPNHVHLLVTPRERGATGRMMQDIGRRYVRVLNNVHGRTGTLWEGRFRSSLVHDERYFVTLHRYIERNPVRAGLARHPADYPWCSYAHYCGSRMNPLITEHPAFHALAPTLAERRAAFCELFAEDIDAEALKTIREAIDADSPIGAEIRKRGRPREEKQQDSSPLVICGKLF